MIQLVAFLGNYGREYETTRHNVAWLFAQSLDVYNTLSWQKKYSAEFSFLEATPNRPRVYFLKPLTYMNASGEAVGKAATFYKIPARDILIVHDEIELPFGTVSLKWSGGLGGHNGLRSVKACLGTADFWRLRFGVGKGGPTVADYVLSPFSKEEFSLLHTVFSQSHTLFSSLLDGKDTTALLAEWKKKNVLS